MTTTKEPETAEKTWTVREVQRQKETLADLRSQLVELADREETLDQEIAEAMAAGESPNGLKEERREVRELRRDLEGVEPVLQEKIRERWFLAHRELARERLQSVKKAVGGLCGEAPRRLEKAEKLAEKLVAQLEWLAGLSTRRRLLVMEADMLADAAGLEVPEMRSPDVNVARGVENLKRRVQAVHGPGDRLLLTIRRARTKGDHRKAAEKVDFQLGKLFDTETPLLELLAQLETDKA